MDRSTGRRRLGVAAIVVAALASAGTSPAPTPSPDLTSSEQGVLTVTADAPVAWVDVTADEDPDLIAAQGQTTVRLSAIAQNQGVFLIADEPGSQGNRSEALGSTGWAASCPAGEPCGATVRLTAILLDPVGHPSVDVEYTATAEARFPANGGPIPTAQLGVDVSDVSSIPADAAGIAITVPEEVHVGPDAPRAVRSVHVSLPAGPAADATLAPGALLLTTDPQGRPEYEWDVFPRLLSAAGPQDLRASAATMLPFVDCPPENPCEVDLDLAFDWGGGTADGSSLEWSLAVWPGVSPNESTEPAIIDPPVPTEVSWDGPMLSVSTSGSTHTAKTGGGSASVFPALDLSNVPQRAGDVTGLVRLTLRATLAPGSDPATKVRFGFAGNDDATVGPGQTVTVYSPAFDVTCEPRSICPLNPPPLGVGFYPDESSSPEATVDWTADVEFLSLGSNGLPDGATLTLGPPPTPLR